MKPFKPFLQEMLPNISTRHAGDTSLTVEQSSCGSRHGQVTLPWAWTSVSTCDHFLLPFPIISTVAAECGEGPNAKRTICKFWEQAVCRLETS